MFGQKSLFNTLTSLFWSFIKGRKRSVSVIFGAGLLAAGLEASFLLLFRSLTTEFSKSSSPPPAPFWQTLQFILFLLLVVVALRTVIYLFQSKKLVELVQNWMEEERSRFFHLLQSSRYPMARKPQRDALYRILEADFSHIKSALLASHHSIFALLQIGLLAPLLLIFSQAYFMGFILLALPAVMLSRWRIKILHRGGSLNLGSKERVRWGLQQFLDRLEYFQGNGSLPSQAKTLSGEWEAEEVHENKWEFRQIVFPQLMELFYFVLLTGLVGLAITIQSSSGRAYWDLLPFSVLLLMMYKPIREWSRNHPKLLLGEKSWSNVQKVKAQFEKEPRPEISVHDGDLEIRNLKFGYAPEKHVFHSLNLSVSMQEMTHVSGPNGVGKSTLLKLIAGIEFPEQGEVVYPKAWVKGALKLEYLPQKSLVSFPMLEQLKAFQLSCPREWGVLDRALAVHELVYRNIQENSVPLGSTVQFMRPSFDTLFSGGEAQRLCLASAFISPAPYLLLDEPTTWLPGDQRWECMSTLFHFWKSKNRGILVVSHEPEMGKLCDNVLSLERFNTVSTAIHSIGA